MKLDNNWVTYFSFASDGLMMVSWVEMSEIPSSSASSMLLSEQVTDSFLSPHAWATLSNS